MHEDAYEDNSIENVDIQEILEEIHQVIDDLYQLCLTFLQSHETDRLEQKAYRIINKGSVSLDTLDVYDLPWEWIDERRKIKIKRVVSDQDFDILLEHTRKLREAHRAVAWLENPNRLKKLGLVDEERQEIVINRRRQSSRGSSVERETNVNSETPFSDQIQGSRRSGSGEDMRRTSLRSEN